MAQEGALRSSPAQRARRRVASRDQAARDTPVVPDARGRRSSNAHARLVRTSARRVPDRVAQADDVAQSSCSSKAVPEAIVGDTVRQLSKEKIIAHPHEISADVPDSGLAVHELVRLLRPRVVRGAESYSIEDEGVVVGSDDRHPFTRPVRQHRAKPRIRYARVEVAEIRGAVLGPRRLNPITVGGPVADGRDTAERGLEGDADSLVRVGERRGRRRLFRSAEVSGARIWSSAT